MADRPLIRTLAALAAGNHLDAEAMTAVFGEIMAGETAESEITALLTALTMRGETVPELIGAAQATRARMDPFPVPDADRPLLDTCGTGGDGAGTVNVSTATALLASCCGVGVAKHGNRSASGNCGSAEVLTELGVNLEAPVPVLQRCLSELGITFLFAPRFHPALKHVGAARKRLPFRTLFNLVGPLANPARPDRQLVGVAGDRAAGLIASALLALGVERATVVTGSDGLDEVTLTGPTHVRSIEGGRILEQTWSPADFGLRPVAVEAIRISGPAEGAQRFRRLVGGEPGPVREVVLANTAAALWTAGRAETLPQGVALAAQAIDSGRAAEQLRRWAELSQATNG